MASSPKMTSIFAWRGNCGVSGLAARVARAAATIKIKASLALPNPFEIWAALLRKGQTAQKRLLRRARVIAARRCVDATLVHVWMRRCAIAWPDPNRPRETHQSIRDARQYVLQHVIERFSTLFDTSPPNVAERP